MSLDRLRCEKNRVRWCKINPTCEAKLHEPKRQGDVGWDLEAAEDTYIAPGQAIDVPTNVRLHLPDHVWAEIRARSSIARRGLQVDAGTIDTGYRGPLFALVRNMASPLPGDLVSGATPGLVRVDTYTDWYREATIKIEAGERIAQVVYRRSCPTWAEEVEVIDESSERGKDGFGSTGA